MKTAWDSSWNGLDDVVIVKLREQDRLERGFD